MSITEAFLGRDKGWEYTYQVTGTWPFPMDMLRYDEAVPATLADEVLVRLLSQENPDDVTLIKRRSVITLKGKKVPTRGRWKSLLWRVVE